MLSFKPTIIMVFSTIVLGLSSVAQAALLKGQDFEKKLSLPKQLLLNEKKTIFSVSKISLKNTAYGQFAEKYTDQTSPSSIQTAIESQSNCTSGGQVIPLNVGSDRLTASLLFEVVSIKRPYDFRDSSFQPQPEKQTHYSKTLEHNQVLTQAQAGFHANGSQAPINTFMVSTNTKEPRCEANFQDIARILAYSEQQQIANSLSCCGLYWIISDLNSQFNNIEEPVEVPIPAAAFLFAPALLGFMGLRGKAKSKA